MRRAAWIAGIALAAVLALTLVLRIYDGDPSLPRYSIFRGAPTQEALVERYLDAFARNDSDALARLIPETHDAAEEVRMKLEATSGPITVERLTIDTPITSTHAVITIEGVSGSGAPFRDRISVALGHRHRWYLILGCVPSESGGSGDCVHPNL